MAAGRAALPLLALLLLPGALPPASAMRWNCSWLDDRRNVSISSQLTYTQLQHPQVDVLSFDFPPIPDAPGASFIDVALYCAQGVRVAAPCTNCAMSGTALTPSFGAATNIVDAATITSAADASTADSISGFPRGCLEACRLNEACRYVTFSPDASVGGVCELYESCEVFSMNVTGASLMKIPERVHGFEAHATPYSTEMIEWNPFPGVTPVGERTRPQPYDPPILPDECVDPPFEPPTPARSFIECAKRCLPEYDCHYFSYAEFVDDADGATGEVNATCLLYPCVRFNASEVSVVLNDTTEEGALRGTPYEGVVPPPPAGEGLTGQIVYHKKIDGFNHWVRQTDLKSWGDGLAMCQRFGMRLCTGGEICHHISQHTKTTTQVTIIKENGEVMTSTTTRLHRKIEISGNRWAPAGDVGNGWIQVGDAYNGVCLSRSNAVVGVNMSLSWPEEPLWQPAEERLDVFCCHQPRSCELPGSTPADIAVSQTTRTAEDCRQLCSERVRPVRCEGYNFDTRTNLCQLFDQRRPGLQEIRSTFDPWVVSGPAVCQPNVTWTCTGVQMGAPRPDVTDASKIISMYILRMQPSGGRDPPNQIERAVLTLLAADGLDAGAYVVHSIVDELSDVSVKLYISLEGVEEKFKRNLAAMILAGEAPFDEVILLDVKFCYEGEPCEEGGDGRILPIGDVDAFLPLIVALPIVCCILLVALVAWRFRPSQAGEEDDNPNAPVWGMSEEDEDDEGYAKDNLLHEEPGAAEVAITIDPGTGRTLKSDGKPPEDARENVSAGSADAAAAEADKAAAARAMAASHGSADVDSLFTRKTTQERPSREAIGVQRKSRPAPLRTDTPSPAEQEGPQGGSKDAARQGSDGSKRQLSRRTSSRITKDDPPSTEENDRSRSSMNLPKYPPPTPDVAAMPLVQPLPLDGDDDDEMVASPEGPVYAASRRLSVLMPVTGPQLTRVASLQDSATDSDDLDDDDGPSQMRGSLRDRIAEMSMSLSVRSNHSSPSRRLGIVSAANTLMSANSKKDTPPSPGVPPMNIEAALQDTGHDTSLLDEPSPITPEPDAEAGKMPPSPPPMQLMLAKAELDAMMTKAVSMNDDDVDEVVLGAGDTSVVGMGEASDVGEVVGSPPPTANEAEGEVEAEATTEDATASAAATANAPAAMVHPVPVPIVEVVPTTPPARQSSRSLSTRRPESSRNARIEPAHTGDDQANRSRSANNLNRSPLAPDTTTMLSRTPVVMGISGAELAPPLQEMSKTPTASMLRASQSPPPFGRRDGAPGSPSFASPLLGKRAVASGWGEPDAEERKGLAPRGPSDMVAAERLHSDFGQRSRMSSWDGCDEDELMAAAAAAAAGESQQQQQQEGADTTAQAPPLPPTQPSREDPAEAAAEADGGEAPQVEMRIGGDAEMRDAEGPGGRPRLKRIASVEDMEDDVMSPLSPTGLDSPRARRPRRNRRRDSNRSTKMMPKSPKSPKARKAAAAKLLALAAAAEGGGEGDDAGFALPEAAKPVSTPSQSPSPSGVETPASATEERSEPAASPKGQEGGDGGGGGILRTGGDSSPSGARPARRAVGIVEDDSTPHPQASASPPERRPESKRKDSAWKMLKVLDDDEDDLMQLAAPTRRSKSPSVHVPQGSPVSPEQPASLPRPGGGLKKGSRSVRVLMDDDADGGDLLTQIVQPVAFRRPNTSDGSPSLAETLKVRSGPPQRAVTPTANLARSLGPVQAMQALQSTTPNAASLRTQRPRVRKIFDFDDEEDDRSAFQRESRSPKPVRAETVDSINLSSGASPVDASPLARPMLSGSVPRTDSDPASASMRRSPMRLPERDETMDSMADSMSTGWVHDSPGVGGMVMRSPMQAGGAGAGSGSAQDMDTPPRSTMHRPGSGRRRVPDAEEVAGARLMASFSNAVPLRVDTVESSALGTPVLEPHRATPLGAAAASRPPLPTRQGPSVPEDKAGSPQAQPQSASPIESPAGSPYSSPSMRRPGSGRPGSARQRPAANLTDDLLVASVSQRKDVD